MTKTVGWALTTLERVKARLGIKETGFDILIEQLINSITDWIEGQCGGRRFKKTTYTNEIHDGSQPAAIGEGKKRFLLLKHAPITALTSFQYNGGTIGSPSWTNFSTEEYQLLDKEGMIYILGTLPRGFRNIRATYDAGFLIDFANETDTVKHNLPFDLSNLAERLVVKEFKRREEIGKSGESQGDATVSFFDHLEEEDKAVLARYNRIIF
jgi:hypothetical protein